MLGNGNEYQRHYGAAPAQLRAEFFMDSVRDEVATQAAGREIYHEVERVRIIIPGAIASIVVKNVDASHMDRWPEAYKAFKAGQEVPLSGTPLAEWPILNRAQIAELTHLQIRTVEELAGLSDIAVQHVGMGGQILRQRARAFLDDAERESLNARLIAERDQHVARIAALEAQVAELGRQVLQLAQKNDLYRNTPPVAQSYVPAEHDPIEQMRRRQSQATWPGAPGVRPASSLDSFAALGAGRRASQAERSRSAESLYQQPVPPVMPDLPQGTADLEHLLLSRSGAGEELASEEAARRAGPAFALSEEPT